MGTADFMVQELTEVQLPSFKPLFHRFKRHTFAVEATARFLMWRCRNVRSFTFVASSGRSGTATLANLFADIPSGASLHEPYPLMASDHHSDSADHTQLHSSRFEKIKRINILRAAAGKDFYLETNHQFITNFSYSAIDYFADRLSLIHLQRDPISVASSFYAIGSIPGKTDNGNRFLIHPHRFDNILAIGDVLDHDPIFAHDLFRCLWYWYETEARILHFIEEYPAIPIMHMRTKDLNDPEQIAQLLSFLCLEHLAEQVLHKVGHRANQKLNEKQSSIDFEKSQEMDQRLRELLSSRFGVRYIQSG